MAMAKKKPGVEIVFGMGKPSGDDPDAAEEHEEATDTFKSALQDAIESGDVGETLMDALHQYVEACIKKPPEPMADESEDY